jgi:myo-inositol-1(or 4)-monophosphatase
MIRYLQEILGAAGELALAGLAEDLSRDLEFKDSKDLVTVIDRRVEDYLVRQIKNRFPGHDIIGEESGSHLTGSEYCWVIDPIDGTTSYFHRQPYFSVSIALKEKGKLLCGGVYAPALDQMFLAARGEGAALNGEPIHVSQSSRMADSVLATGFACLRAGLEDNNLGYFNRIMPEIRDVRRCGSAALDLAYVAAGKYDGFWEMNLNEYDVAAGILLVLEAGGQVFDFRGHNHYPQDGIIATNGCIDNELLAFF